MSALLDQSFKHYIDRGASLKWETREKQLVQIAFRPLK